MLINVRLPIAHHVIGHPGKCSKKSNAFGKSIKHISYSERLKALWLPTLEYCRERADIIQVYKILHDIDKADREEIFQMAPYTTTRGAPPETI